MAQYQHAHDVGPAGRGNISKPITVNPKEFNKSNTESIGNKDSK